MIDVLLDLDQNPDTGSIYYGTEAGLELQSSGVGFLRLSGSRIRGLPRPPSLRGGFSNGTAIFTVKAADLGLWPSAGFNVLMRAVADWAPNYRSFNYQMVPRTPPLDPGPDTRAPFVHAMSSKGHHRYGAELCYTAADGRGKTAEVIRVYRGARLVKEFRERLQNTNPLVRYSESWRIRHRVRPGRLHFCVRSRDEAGNESKPSCAKLDLY